MASSGASDNLTCSMEMHLKCSVCMQTFSDPITAACGHSFCRTCQDDAACPLCTKPVGDELEVNLVLRNIIQLQQRIPETTDDMYTGKDGEVPCDVCTGNRLKAVKSCLVCLASYCSSHLENHRSSQRLKGHSLVDPVKNLDERACLEHGRPLELYNRKQRKCVCVRCLEEDGEEVVSTEEEWSRKKAELENTKTHMKEKIQKRQTKRTDINTSLTDCKDLLDKEWWDIDAVFCAIHAIVEEAHATVLKPLKERRQRLEREADDLQEILTSDIQKLEKTIQDLNELSNLEDHIFFLQNYSSLSDLDITDLADVEFDTSLMFGSMRKNTKIMMETIQEELEKLTSVELKRVSQFAVDVKSDPATSDQHYVQSNGGRTVEHEGDADATEWWHLSGNILEPNSLTSGKSYWEVDVSNRTGWDLGLARYDATNGEVCPNPDINNRLRVQLDGFPAPPARLSLKHKPDKVGVFVDYKEGLLSFYNLTAQSHMYSFTDCSFTGEVFPYFGPRIRNDRLSV
ncbi:E3 ubiquitin-protein ligase TRIM39-like [Betta splendens]|uniref:E3 ubiquitin-protein ligase TRIM39-like n=1 Tax=Betta splendens TaxID=158456 RepID=A0A6P7LAG1_BETSP|nr:E3 ubiquitin-protein ligase TRIM39-like [Betta splendens]XP_040925600.1 E3 ubiquitin-protein ligase TRIM39-like [Betta splendens]